nr:spore germination protein [Paenibacillus koleovorans]
MGILQNLFNRKRKRTDGPDNHKPVTPPHERLSHRLESNLNTIWTSFGNSTDLVAAELRLERPNITLRLGYMYLSGMADSSTVQEKVKEALLQDWNTLLDQPAEAVRKQPMEWLANQIPAVIAKKRIADFSDVFKCMLAGDTVLLLDGADMGLVADTAGDNCRSIEEPNTQSVVRGPRDGFTESMDMNVALLRKRIRSHDLWLESSTIGVVTQTRVGYLYLHGIANDKIVEEVRLRLSRIDIDGILESGNIEELIQDETFTPFPTMYNSERPRCNRSRAAGRPDCHRCRRHTVRTPGPRAVRPVHAVR